MTNLKRPRKEGKSRVGVCILNKKEIQNPNLKGGINNTSKYLNAVTALFYLFFIHFKLTVKYLCNQSQALPQETVPVTLL